MEVIFPTGIVQDFPCARTGRILSSSGMADILAIKTKIPGSIGRLPAQLSGSFIGLVATSIIAFPSFWSNKFESINGELVVFVEIDDKFANDFLKKRYRARLIMSGIGELEHRIDKVFDIPAFWIEELEEGEMP